LEVDEQEMLFYQCQSRSGGAAMDLRLELVSVPVADVDRAKAFYVDQVGFGVEQDVQVDANHRFVELMPPGSPCSIALTTSDIDSLPGCLKGVHLNVENVDEVYVFLRDLDVEVSEIQHFPWGRFCFFPTPMATVGQSTVRCIRGRSDE
jgi:catechol 2,3-dioxygenase-like lactoylglutathione lyase family enzyme